MSPAASESSKSRRRSHAAVFAALGDQTRLALIAQLGHAGDRSIADLTAQTAITRQAVTKHLRVLRHAGIVRDLRRGRERLYSLAPNALADAQAALNDIAQQWQNALARLKAFAEQ